MPTHRIGLSPLTGCWRKIMSDYRWNIGEAHTAIAVPMIKQNRVKLSRTKLRKKLFRYYKRAKYGGGK